jgi:hypothetical protein
LSLLSFFLFVFFLRQKGFYAAIHEPTYMVQSSVLADGEKLSVVNMDGENGAEACGLRSIFEVGSAEWLL